MLNKQSVALVTYRCPLETFIYDLAVNIKSFDPIILSYISYEHTNPQQSKMPIYSLSSLNILNRLFNSFTLNFGNSKYFEEAIKKHNIKLLHAQFAPVGVGISSFSKNHDIPLITNFRGQDAFELSRNNYNLMLLRRLFKTGQLFLTTSDHMRKHIIDNLGCPAEKALTFYGGIDLAKFPFIYRKPKENIQILMCGRLIEKKGFPYGIKAFAECFKKNRNIRLQIIGEGPLRNDLTKLIKRLSLESVISIAGKKNYIEVAEAMQNADIFMMPYVTAKNGDSEGIPNVLKEAMATGLPVISTKHAGVPEIVKEEETGFLVDQKEINGLSNRLNFLIENPNIWPEFGRKARKFVEEEFNIIKQTEKLEKIYKGLINNGK